MSEDTRFETVDCPECEGTGEISIGNPGGYFDSTFGNYLPDDRCRDCDDCNGTGQIEQAVLEDEEDNSEEAA